MTSKRKPPADDAAKGAKGNTRTDESSAEWAPPPMNPKAVKVFTELALLPRHVGYVAVYNPKRKKWDKVPHNGTRKLSTADETDWGPMLEVAQAATGRGLSGIGVVFTGGIEVDGETLVGFDFDDVTGPIELLEALGTYSEISPSGTGKRALAWVPTEALAGYKDNTDGHPDGCDHAEIYMGTAARFLTLTFHPDGEVKPIAHLAQNHPAMAALLGLLKRKEDDSKAPAPMIEGTGTPIDLDALLAVEGFDSTGNFRKLLEGAGQPEIDRHKVVRGLLRKLIDHKDQSGKPFSQEDIFATLTQHPALWLYLLDHRNHNPAKAMAFANTELANAFNASTTGKLAKVFANPLWKVVDTTDDANPVDVDPPDTEAPDDYYMPTIGEWMKKPKTARFAVGKQFLKGATNIMYGDSGHGKTTFLAGLAVCKAQAVLDPSFKWMGMDIHDPRPQRIIAGEDAVGVVNMVLGYCKVLGIDPEALPLRVSECAYDFSLDDEVSKVKAGIKADIERYGIHPDFTVDTLSCNSGSLEENSATDMRILLNRLDELRGDATVNVSHHNGLEHADRERGSSVIRKNPTSNNYCKSENGIFTYTCKKQRGAKPAPPLTMRFMEVVIGKDADGSDLTTAVLVLAGEDCRELRVNSFYARYTKLGGDRRSYMEILLLNIYGRPGLKQIDLAKACGLSQSAISKAIKQLREYQLIEPEDPLKLTQLGVEGLAELSGDLKASFAAQGLEVQASTIVPRPV
ncbi:AAA family ATPase [Pseudomonas sp.]|uniref:AAA family ATPase n=1 Tax=Pseudomonas sp. TaxID=306 RepID=UPI0029B3F8A9|nr:AAA family ATPase [Pseudomonas sp.]MDX3742436.1 AAA family ATPase [Pseudomonas sp.]